MELKLWWNWYETLDILGSRIGLSITDRLQLHDRFKKVAMQEILRLFSLHNIKTGDQISEVNSSFRRSLQMLPGLGVRPCTGWTDMS
jgi:arginine decarboxylase-like protein